MKVECINDKRWIPGFKSLGDVGAKPYGDLIHFGDIYTVVGTYLSDRGVKMFTFAEVDRNDPDMGPGWAQSRFKPLRRTTTKTEIKETVKV